MNKKSTKIPEIKKGNNPPNIELIYFFKSVLDSKLLEQIISLLGSLAIPSKKP